MDIASLRILRLALGTALSMLFSQAVAWDSSFIAPVLTMFILALPLPAPRLKGGIVFVLALSLSLYAGLLLLPTLLNQRLVGILLLTIALYWSFYYTAKGGNAPLGTFATVGIAMSTAVGTVSIDAVFSTISGITIGAVFGVVFAWIAHALLPDSAAAPVAMPAAAKRPPPPPPDLARARWSAFRSLVIVFPVAFWFLLSSVSNAYMPVMIKVASMGQQATNDATRHAGRSLIQSTLIGGIGAIIGWQVLRVFPSLVLYVLLVGLAGLLMGRRIFAGPAMHPQAGTWSYGYLTMLVILAPAVLDSAGGVSADVKFWDRLVMFAGTTLYSVAAVYVFDAFWRPPEHAAQTTT